MILVQEVETRSPNRLELPKWHLPHDLIDIPYKRFPGDLVSLGRDKGVAVFLASLDDLPDYRRLFARVLTQDLAVRWVDPRHVRNNLPPIILNELFGYQLCGDRQSLAAIVTGLDGDVRQRQQQGVLVRRNELALGQQSLDVGQKLELLLSGWRAHEGLSQYTAFSGMIQRTPPRGSGTSPLYRGMMWT